MHPTHNRETLIRHVLVRVQTESPLTHCWGVAKRPKASDFESDIRKFESSRPSQFRCLAQFGSALRLGRRGRRFKSCNTDQFYVQYCCTKRYGCSSVGRAAVSKTVNGGSSPSTRATLLMGVRS